jgi:hypothetical protein
LYEKTILPSFCSLIYGYDRYSIIVPFYLTGKSASGTPNIEMAPAFGLAVRIGK